MTGVPLSALDPHLSVTSCPAVGAAFKVERRPHLGGVNTAIEADDQVWVARFDGESGVGQCGVNFFSVHDFALS